MHLRQSQWIVLKYTIYSIVSRGL